MIAMTSVKSEKIIIIIAVTCMKNEGGGYVGKLNGKQWWLFFCRRKNDLNDVEHKLGDIYYYYYD